MKDVFDSELPLPPGDSVVKLSMRLSAVDRDSLFQSLEAGICSGCNERHASDAECEAPSARMDSPEMMK